MYTIVIPCSYKDCADACIEIRSANQLESVLDLMNIQLELFNLVTVSVSATEISETAR